MILNIKNVLRIVILVFVLVCIGLAFYGLPKQNVAWISIEAKTFVVRSMREFCTDLYNGVDCSQTQLTGKSRWIISTRFEVNNAPSIMQVQEIFRKKGWIRSETRAGNDDIFCKAGYRAAYERLDGAIRFVAFESGDKNCLDGNERK